MKIFRFLFTLLISFSTISLFSQTQSLWSKVRKEKFEGVGLSAMQYQTPLWGQQNSFFDIEKTRGNNQWINPCMSSNQSELLGVECERHFLDFQG